MSTTTTKRASDRQQAFITTLLSERVTEGWDIPDLTRISSMEASNMIGALLKAPRKETGRVVSDDSAVPEGRYAITVEGESALRFFRVSRPSKGRWAGRVFVSQLSSDDEYPVRGARAAKVLAAIGEDVAAAGRTYGQEIGRCCRCNRTLTDESSRLAGIGPDCAEKL